MRFILSLCRRLAAVVLGAGLAASAAAPARAVDALAIYENRAALAAAAQHCGALSANEAAAQALGLLQARHDALRAGASLARLAAADEDAARRTARLACDAPDLQQSIAALRQSFPAFLRQGRAVFAPDWRASKYARDVWAVRFGADLQAPTLGLIPHRGGLSLAIDANGAARAVGAVLLTRNPSLQPAPILSAAGPLPPAGFAATSWPVAAILDQGRFALSDAALAALLALDPREAVLIRLFDRRGAIAAERVIPVGDVAIAIRFAQLPLGASARNAN